jgi:hypothetical protein
VYIGCTGHVHVVGEGSGPTFFITYIGCTGHVEASGEFTGA